MKPNIRKNTSPVAQGFCIFFSFRRSSLRLGTRPHVHVPGMALSYTGL